MILKRLFLFSVVALVVICLNVQVVSAGSGQVVDRATEYTLFNGNSCKLESRLSTWTYDSGTRNVWSTGVTNCDYNVFKNRVYTSVEKDYDLTPYGKGYTANRTDYNLVDSYEQNVSDGSVYAGFTRHTLEDSYGYSETTQTSTGHWRLSN